MAKKSSARARAIANGYRSGFEEDFKKDLESRGIAHNYEQMKISWLDSKVRRYTPDFLLLESGIIIETKGRFTASDRRKHLEIKKQHPDLDIRFIFQRATTKINRGSKTSYGDWCDKHGFKWAEKVIPEEWLDE